jgi:pilus assembly protein CpaF
MQRNVDGSDSHRPTDLFSLDVTAEENLYLLDVANHFRNRLLAEENLDEIADLPPKILRARIESHVSSMMKQEGQTLPPAERASLITFIINETVGLGPLERLIGDPTITEIMVNGPDEVYVERKGKITRRPDVRFKDEAHVRHIIDRVISPLGRRIDESSPMVDARLPDGSRVNAAIDPVSLNGPVLTIRKFRKEPFLMPRLVENGTLSEEMAEFLRACVIAKQNIIVSGGTGSGKTTTLNVLASFIPKDERVITIEDAAELQFHLTHPHVLRMEARPPNVEGQGEITIRQLVRNALRMRPDRIVVGEVRGAEALDMLQAMNTGHEGSLTTIHANSPRDAFSRLETMIMWAEGAKQLPLSAVREHLVGAVNIVAQQDRLSDGTRRIVAISEVYGIRKEQIIVRDIFVFERTGVDEKSGRVLGSFTPTGIRPRCLPRIRAAGVHLSDGIFMPQHLVSVMGVDLLESEDVTEIMVNSPDEVYVERNGRLERVEKKFRDETHLLSEINKIVAPIGRRIDETTPAVDARLPDGSRVNAVLPPIALNGPVLTIRRFPKDPLKIEHLLANHSLTQEIYAFLKACVRAKLNILISGGTGSGKTTTLNVLSAFIPEDERIITIEDVAELQLKQPHVVRLESRPRDEYGEGEITIRDLVRNALRMRPNRIIVGEVRGGEALDVLQAMNTGHEGSLTTIHANSPIDAFARLETMVMWAGTQLPSHAIREQLVGAINIVIQQDRLSDGSRKITAISEIQSAQRGKIDLKDIFVFEQESISEQGQVKGDFKATGLIPKSLPKIRAAGIDLSESFFAKRALLDSRES